MHIAILLKNFFKKMIFQYLNQHIIVLTGMVYLQFKTFVLSSLFVARRRTAY